MEQPPDANLISSIRISMNNIIGYEHYTETDVLANWWTDYVAFNKKQSSVAHNKRALAYVQWVNEEAYWLPVVKANQRQINGPNVKAMMQRFLMQKGADSVTINILLQESTLGVFVYDGSRTAAYRRSGPLWLCVTATNKGVQIVDVNTVTAAAARANDGYVKLFTTSEFPQAKSCGFFQSAYLQAVISTEIPSS